MYAIVKSGGKQYRVAEGDVVVLERIIGEPGSTVRLPVLLVVEGDDVTTDLAALAQVHVTGEIVEHGKGPKIRIHHFKNKTGYHRRLGHRQLQTRVKVTGIARRADNVQEGTPQPGPSELGTGEPGTGELGTGERATNGTVGTASER